MNKPAYGSWRIRRVREGLYDVEMFHDPILGLKVLAGWTRSISPYRPSLPSFGSEAEAREWLHGQLTQADVVAVFAPDGTPVSTARSAA